MQRTGCVNRGGRRDMVCKQGRRFVSRQLVKQWISRAKRSCIDGSTCTVAMQLSVACGLVVVATAVVFCFAIVFRCYKWLLVRRCLPPGPWALPLLGGTAVRWLHDPLTRRRWYERYGRVVTVSTLARHLVLISDVSLLRKAFGQPQFCDSCARTAMFHLSLFGMCHERHKCVRPLATQALHRFGFGDCESVAALVADELSSLLEFMESADVTVPQRFYSEANSKHATSQKMVDHHRSSLHNGPSTIDVCRAMGENRTINTGKNTHRPRQNEECYKQRNHPLLHELRCLAYNVMWRLVGGKHLQPSKSRLNIIIEALDALFANMPTYMRYTQISWLLRIVWPTFAASEQRLLVSLRLLDGEFEACLNRHRCRRRRCSTDDDITLVDEFLRLQRQHPTVMTDKQIAVLLRDYFMGSYESLSNTVLWMLHLVAEYPDWQRRAQAELDVEAIGSDGQLRPAAWDDRDRFPVCRAIIAETHRVASVAPLGNPHACSMEGAVLGDYPLPAGAIVLADLHNIHHDPDVWPQPSRFDPQRFLDELGQFRSHTHLIPFSVGRRRCLGDKVSEQILFLMTTALLSAFWFHPQPPSNESSKDSTWQKPAAGFTHPPPMHACLWTRRRVKTM